MIFKVILRQLFSKFKSFIRQIFGVLDGLIKKNENYWVFPSYFIGDAGFCDNALAVYEEVKLDRTIKKIILIKKNESNLTGDNIIVCKMRSFKGLYYLMKSKVVFVQHSFWLDYRDSLLELKNTNGRDIINLWHGVAIKDLSNENTGIINKNSAIEMPSYYVISSSDTDCMNMRKAFSYTNVDRFWVTGLPRNDFLKLKYDKLPIKYRRQIEYLESQKNGHRFILYAPTYREEGSVGQYEFKDEELIRLEALLIENNFKLLLRYHMYRKPRSYEKMLKLKNVIEVDESSVSDVRAIIRVSDLIITDYSSLYVDALYIDKPCLSFAYDYQDYMSIQRGFFYEFESIFPGDICCDFDSLLNGILSFETKDNDYKDIKEKLFRYSDASNSKRVVDYVKNIGVTNA